MSLDKMSNIWAVETNTQNETNDTLKISEFIAAKDNLVANTKNQLNQCLSDLSQDIPEIKNKFPEIENRILEDEHKVRQWIISMCELSTQEPENLKAMTNILDQYLKAA